MEKYDPDSASGSECFNDDRESEGFMNSFMDRDNSNSELEFTKKGFDDDLNDRISTSDYNTNYGISDDQFKKIQEQMKLNISKNEVHQEPALDDTERKENYRIQFEIKSQMENLKK